MFDVRAKSKAITITNFYLTLVELTDLKIEIYTKVGSHLSYSENPDEWETVGKFSVDGDVKYSPQILPYDSITTPQTIGKWQTRAFYITSSNSSSFYVTKGSNYSKMKKPLVQNSDLKILEGCSLSHIFDNKWGECKESDGGESYNLWGGVEYYLT